MMGHYHIVDVCHKFKICDIKEKAKKKGIYSSTSSTSTHSHNKNGPLPGHDEVHGGDGIHYEDSVETVHPQLGSNYNQARCALTQPPPEEEPTSSLPQLPQPHSYVPGNEILSRPPSMTSPSTTWPNALTSAESKVYMSDVSISSPLKMMFGMTSGMNDGGVNPGAADRKGAE